MALLYFLPFEAMNNIYQFNISSTSCSTFYTHNFRNVYKKIYIWIENKVHDRKTIKNGYVFPPDLFRRYNAIVLKGYDPDVIS